MKGKISKKIIDEVVSKITKASKEIEKVII